MYRKGEVVWAKLKGFPYWPATISEIIDNKNKKSSPPIPYNEFKVNFFGENNYATLPENKIHKFEDKLSEFSTNIKKKNLIEAIEEAKKFQNASKRPTNEKNSNLKRKNAEKDAEIEKTAEIRDKTRQEDSSVDSKILRSETRKKVKIDDFSPACERFTRSKIMSKETPAEKPEKSASFLVKPVETPAFSLEMRQKNENSGKNEKNCNNNAIISHNTKGNGFSSVKASILLKKKEIPANNQRNFAFIKKKMHPAAMTCSKIVKKLASSGNHGKGFAKISQKSVSDSTNEGFDENILIRNLEKKLKYGIEIVVKETLYEKNYPEIIKTINECVGDINKIFINQNSQALVSLLSRNIGKEMALLEKLCEENKEHLNQLFNIDYYVKELKKANGKIESQIYYQFFDCSPLMKELKIPYTPNTTDFNITEFFATCETKQKFDPFQTPKRNNSLYFPKKKSSIEDLDLHHSDEISSVNNTINNEENCENLKNLETSRLISKESKESETKNHGHVENKHLRKRVCQKMSQILQEKYTMEKNKSQELTLQIEEKIRNNHPDMREDYKEKIRIILKLMKEKIISVERFMENEINFEFLKLKFSDSTPMNKSEDGCTEKFITPKPEKLSEFI